MIASEGAGEAAAVVEEAAAAVVQSSVGSIGWRFGRRLGERW